MSDTSIEKAIDRDGLPEGKHDFTETEMNLAVQHCRKMIRDAALFGALEVLLTSAAIYNWKQFELQVPAGYEEKEADSSITAEFGYSERQTFRYYAIGRELADALGGGFISARMIGERIQADIFKGRLGFRKIAELTKIKLGMQQLVSAKNPEDVTSLLDQISLHANALTEAKDAGAGTSGKPGKKDAKKIRYSEKRPPSKDELYQLERDVADELHRIANGSVKRLCEAAGFIPANERENYRSTKLTNSGQSVYNELWRVIDALQERLSPIHIDALANAHALERTLNSSDTYAVMDTPRMQAAPTAAPGELPEDDAEALKALGITSQLL